MNRDEHSNDESDGALMDGSGSQETHTMSSKPRKSDSRTNPMRNIGRSAVQSSRSESRSPEVICLDDTDSEASPEKKMSPRKRIFQEAAPPPKLQLEAEETPAVNGSVLDEFVTLNPAPASTENAAIENCVSNGTQTPEPLPPPRKFSTAGINLNNSDATFHRRVKELFPEMEKICLEMERSIGPQLCAQKEEMARLIQDISTLTKQISQSEEEQNRLKYLRTLKEERRAKLEHNERAQIIQELLTPIQDDGSASRRYNMQDLLLQEITSPSPPRDLTIDRATEQLLNNMEINNNNIQILRSVLGIRNSLPNGAPVAAKPPPPPFDESQLRN